MKSKNKIKDLCRNINRISSFNSVTQTFLLVIAAILTTIFIHSFVLRPYQVDGISMQPTLEDGDKLIVSKVGVSISKLFNNDFVPKRGEIIVFEYQDVNKTIELIKRVVGLPGESLEIKDGRIIIYNLEYPHGLKLDKDFEEELIAYHGDFEKTDIGQRQIFVVGDNRMNGGSRDSRNSLGNISIDSIGGVLELRLFPFDKLRLF